MGAREVRVEEAVNEERGVMKLLSGTERKTNSPTPARRVKNKMESASLFIAMRLCTVSIAYWSKHRTCDRL